MQFEDLRRSAHSCSTAMLSPRECWHGSFAAIHPRPSRSICSPRKHPCVVCGFDLPAAQHVIQRALAEADPGLADTYDRGVCGQSTKWFPRSFLGGCEPPAVRTRPGQFAPRSAQALCYSPNDFATEAAVIDRRSAL